MLQEDDLLRQRIRLERCAKNLLGDRRQTRSGYDHFKFGASTSSVRPDPTGRTTALRAADQAASVKAKDSQAAAILRAASVGWMVDRCFDPEQVAKQALQLDNGKVTQIAASTTLASCNAAKAAEQLLSNLEKRYPQDTLVQELNVPQSRAWLAIKAGDPQRALALLERVRAHDDASFAPYMRGLAYLQLKDSHNAITLPEGEPSERPCLQHRQPLCLVLLGAWSRLCHGRRQVLGEKGLRRLLHRVEECRL